MAAVAGFVHEGAEAGAGLMLGAEGNGEATGRFESEGQAGGVLEGGLVFSIVVGGLKLGYDGLVESGVDCGKGHLWGDFGEICVNRN